MSEKTKHKTLKKVLSWILTAICILAVLFALALCFLSLSAKKNNRAVELFGYSFSIVKTDSMTPEIKVGELITVKRCDISNVTIGDYAVWRGPIGGTEAQIVHKTIETGTDEKGAFIVTQGVKEGTLPDAPVYADNFVGIAVNHSVFWGKVMGFLAQPYSLGAIFVTVIGLYVVVWLAKGIFQTVREMKKPN